MEDSSDDQLEWRDTYFILFQQSNRPTLTQVEAAITGASRRLKLENLEADDDGMFESVLVQAPQDNAALEISYETGDAVVQQSTELARQLKDEVDAKQLAAVLKADARLDVMLFERVERRSWSDRKRRRRRLGRRIARPVESAERGRGARETDPRPADRPGVGGDYVVNESRVES